MYNIIKYYEDKDRLIDVIKDFFVKGLESNFTRDLRSTLRQEHVRKEFSDKIKINSDIGEIIKEELLRSGELVDGFFDLLTNETIIDIISKIIAFRKNATYIEEKVPSMISEIHHINKTYIQFLFGVSETILKRMVNEESINRFVTEELTEKVDKQYFGAELKKFGAVLSQTVRQAKGAKLIHSGTHSFKVKTHDGSDKTDKIIAIGGSTGATEALPTVLAGMNIHTPPIICTIHMPEGYPAIYAERINKQLKIEVREVKDGLYLKRGMAVIAQGSRHMRIYKDKNGYFVTSEAGPKVSGHCPSVDVMFESCAYCAKDNAIGVILTGMGDDGATGLLTKKKAGAFTIGQDEASSLVYGMPKAAFELGAVDVQTSLDNISYEIYKRLKKQ